MHCRGEDRRIQIVEDYDVKPIAHLRLLHGQEKHSDAEAKLTATYYIFECTLKLDRKIKETIVCGEWAGEHFLKLTNQESPPLFDPLKTFGTGKKGSGVKVAGSQDDQWNKAAKQLYNAIQWLIVSWDIVPTGPILKIKDEVVKSYRNAPTLGQIKGINKIISSDYRKRTLTEMIEEFGKTNTIKSYDFSLLASKLEERGLQSFF
jgi:hypothetical protein